MSSVALAEFPLDVLRTQRGPFNRPRIISFRGNIGAGKSTASRYVASLYPHMAQVSFAQPLKVEIYDGLVNQSPDMLEIGQKLGMDIPYTANVVTCLPWKSVPDDRAKVVAINAQKQALRRLLQYWGTEFRRGHSADYKDRKDCYEGYWTDIYKRRVKALLSEGIDVITDDARFPNERTLIAELGGVEVFILDPWKHQRLFVSSYYDQQGHESERLVDPTDPGIDYLISNQRTVEKFQSAIRAVIYQIASDK